MRTQRFDYTGSFRGVHDTSQGGVRVPAYIARTGVQTYKRGDGSVYREYRPAEEVFHADALASFKFAPVTVGHPSEVRADNWRQHAVGHATGEVAAAEDKYVATELVVQDSDAVAGIRDKSLIEVSCGYTCDLDETPGTFEGVAYDGVQRNIRGNHIALGPKDWGRAGGEVSLRTDGAYNAYTENMADNSNLEAANKRADAAEGRAEAESKRADVAEGKVEALQARVRELEAALDPKRLDTLVQARIDLISQASRFLGDSFDYAGKSDRDVMTAALVKQNAQFRADGRSDDFLRGAFEALASAPSPALSELRGALPVGNRADAEDKLLAAKRRSDERASNAYKFHRNPKAEKAWRKSQESN